MQKPAIPGNEKERQELLDSYQIINTLPEESFDDLTLIASQICQTPIALVSLIDNDRQWFKSKYGLEVEETHRDLSFCGHAINKPNKLFEISNTSKDERFSDNPLVEGEPNIKFYAGVPLIDKNNLALGTLCVIDTKERELTPEQRKALTALAREVMNRLKLYKRSKRLESSSKSYRTNLDNVSGMIFEADTNLKLKFVNQFMSKCLQIEKSELLEEKFYDIIHSDDRAQVKLMIEKLVEGAIKELNLEFRIINGNEEIRWVNQNLKLIDAEKGKKILGCLRDVSEEKTKAKQIAEKTYLLEKSEALSRVGHWEVNLKENTVYWSKETKRIHEVNSDYVPNLEEGINFYTEESKPIITNAIERAITNGESWDLILQILTIKGNKRWVRAIGNAEDMGTKIIGVFQDITDDIRAKEKLLANEKEIKKLNLGLEKKVEKRTTELNESNRKYSKLYHGAPDMMISINPKTKKIVDCNKTTLDKLGYKREEVVGEEVFKFYHKDCLEDAKSALEDFKKNGKIENKKLILLSRTGEKIYVSLNTNAVYNDNGEVVRSNSTWRDISELKEAEDKLYELNKNLESKVRSRTYELKSANEELENFTYITTHDIKSPLSNTLGYITVLEELLEDNEEEMVHKSIDWIKKLNRKAIDKVEGVIEVVKAKEPSNKETLNLKKLILEVINEIREADMELDLQLELDNSTSVCFGEKSLKSILFNLISNAVKYRKFGEKAKLTISTEKSGEKTVIKIKDEGLGIDLEKKRHKLFKMFSRLHDHVEGNGMGLYLVKKILETSGGGIEVESELNKETTFIITI